jgi:heptosyltransferase-2
MPLAGPCAKGLRAPWRAARMLRAVGADATLLLPNSFASALAARLARIPVRVGTPLQGRGWLLTHAVRVPVVKGRPAPRAMRAHYLDLAAPFGARDDGAGTALATTPFDEARADRRLAALPAGARFLVVSPGAAFAPTKLWPPERWGAAARALRERTGLVPVVACAPGEEALARAVASAAGEPCLSTHDDPPDLGELKAIVRRAAVVLATDAGPRHVAEAFRVPTVVVMGPTDPRWGEGGGARVVRNESLSCLGCHLVKCPIGHPCMEALPPEAVVEAAVAVWAGAGRAPDPRVDSPR